MAINHDFHYNCNCHQRYSFMIYLLIMAIFYGYVQLPLIPLDFLINLWVWVRIFSPVAWFSHCIPIVLPICIYTVNLYIYIYCQSIYIYISVISIYVYVYRHYITIIFQHSIAVGSPVDLILFRIQKLVNPTTDSHSRIKASGVDSWPRWLQEFKEVDGFPMFSSCFQLTLKIGS